MGLRSKCNSDDSYEGRCIFLGQFNSEAPRALGQEVEERWGVRSASAHHQTQVAQSTHYPDAWVILQF